MNVFKNRDNTRKWNLFDDKEYVDIARKEMNKVAPSWIEEGPIDLDSYKESVDASGDRQGLNDPFCRAEFDRALRSCRDKSSPGLDGIDYKMLKCLPDVYRNKLLDRMNFAFQNCKMFEDWKNILTMFIGKKDQKKVRPISMSSCVVKYSRQ